MNPTVPCQAQLLIEEHLPWLVRVAYHRKWFKVNGAEHDDLLQEGRIALWKCLQEGRPLVPEYLHEAARNAMWTWANKTLLRQNPVPYELVLDYSHVEASTTP